MTSEQAGDTVVIGLGNPLMGDDGLGLRAMGRLAETWALPPEVELIDGGTWGMNLLPVIERAGRVLLLDAIDVGAPAGTQITLERHELPRYFALKLSPHQVDLREVLALAEWRGTLPGDAVAIGLQPQRIELGRVLSPAVEAAVDRMVARAVRRLEAWGHVLARRPEPVSCTS